MKAGIIGGTGKMGMLFSPVFERAGYQVIVSGRTTDVTSAEIAQTCDLMLVSVPIRDTVQVIQEIAPLLTKEQLLCDFTSLKVAPWAAMLESKAQVIGLHPMFGPTVSSIIRQTIVMCPARVTGTTLSDFRDIFLREERSAPSRPRGARPDDGDRPGAHPLCHDLHGRLHTKAGCGHREDRTVHEPVTNRALACGPAPLA